MTFSELLIIYFAVGAPFGVIELFKTKPGPVSVSLLWATAALCLWPVLALQTLLATSKRRDFNNGSDESSSFDAEIAGKVREVLIDSGHLRDHGFRSALEHYAALTSSASNSAIPDLAQATEILSIGGHKNEEIGAVCIARRNRKRLRLHQERATADLYDAIGACLNAKTIKIRTAKQVAHLCKVLNDDATAALIERLIHSTATVPTPRFVSSVETT